MQKTTHCCKQMDRLLCDHRVPIRYLDTIREYRLLKVLPSERLPHYFLAADPFHFGITLSFCPWCGTRLPASLFNEWQRQIMQKLPHEEWQNTIFLLDSIPQEYQSDTWWKQQKL